VRAQGRWTGALPDEYYEPEGSGRGGGAHRRRVCHRARAITNVRWVLGLFTRPMVIC